MSEKLINTAVQWRIFGSTQKVMFLVVLTFGAMLAIWAMDQSAITSFIEAFRYAQRTSDFQPQNPHNPQTTTTTTDSAYPPETHHETLPNASDSDSIISLPPSSTSSISPSNGELMSSNWVTAELEHNYSAHLLARGSEPGGSPCRGSLTVDIRIPELDRNGTTISFPAGDAHEIVFQAVDENGNPLCSGGDFFEIDLSGDRWKSRPLTKDQGNGSYSITLQVHPEFAGGYNLTIIHLFRHYEGLRFSPTRFAIDKQLRRIPISFSRPGSDLPPLPTCRGSDFNRSLWSGRWTRHARNDDCQISDDGRYRCQPPDFPCPDPWCSGSLGSLESNGWVYSAQCKFKLFSSSEAWECLDNKWLFWWGDSNHVDTVRNLLFFFLGIPDLEVVTRRFEKNFTNPLNGSQSIRVTNIFNGHWDDKGNYEGLNSLSDPGYRDLIRSYFNGSSAPDAVIFNSGLHDGVKWKNSRRFAAAAESAASFWAEAVGTAAAKPRFVFRSTVATGGYARTLAFNPSKMEAFNGVLLDKLRVKGLVDATVDDFDMTWPWHFDNRCNDGVHYGRFPAKMKWRDGQIGHQYFVDLMLGHVLLNAICSR